MPDPTSFHEVRFPIDIALGSTGGPERRTEIVALGSGHEERNTRWADSRRRFNAGFGIKTLADLHQVIDFFEERRGRLYGFRYRDPADHRSGAPGLDPAPDDQEIGTGDGANKQFQLVKTYGSVHAPYARTISKPVAGTVVIGLDGVEQVSGWSVVSQTGLVTFDTAPGSGVVVSAGFEFDVPVRFDNDQLDINLVAFKAGSIPAIPIVEIRI